MRKILFVLAGLLYFFSAFSQFSINDENYIFNTQSFLNPQVYNPAFMGKRNLANVGITFKNFNNAHNRNIGFDFFAGNYSEYLKGALGFNFSYFTDKTNLSLDIANINYHISGVYNYELEFLNNIEFIFGIRPGLIHFEPSYSNGQTPLVENNFKANIDLGFLIQTESAYFGAAMHHVNQPSFKYFENSANRFQQEFIINAGLDLNINDAVIVSPSAIIQQVSKRNIYQTNISLNIKDLAIAAVSYRSAFDVSSDTLNFFENGFRHHLCFTLGAFIDNYFIGGSYDLYESGAEFYNKQFEITASFYFDRERKLF